MWSCNGHLWTCPTVIYWTRIISEHKIISSQLVLQVWYCTVWYQKLIKLFPTYRYGTGSGSGTIAIQYVCVNGSIPIQGLQKFSNLPIKNYKTIETFRCICLKINVDSKTCTGCVKKIIFGCIFFLLLRKYGKLIVIFLRGDENFHCN